MFSTAADLRRVTWGCLHFAPGGLPDAERAELAAGGVVVVEVDAAGWRGEEDLFTALAGALHLPAYFGRNWDALDECLGDLGEWLPATGYVLIVRSGHALWGRLPNAAGRLAEAWLSSAEDWGRRGIPFHLVFV